MMMDQMMIIKLYLITLALSISYKAGFHNGRLELNIKYKTFTKYIYKVYKTKVYNIVYVVVKYRTLENQLVKHREG